VNTTPKRGYHITLQRSAKIWLDHGYSSVLCETMKKALLLGNWGSIEGWLSNKQMGATWADPINLTFGKYSIPFGPPKKVARIGGMTGRVSSSNVEFLLCDKNESTISATSLRSLQSP
jgi:hypothetical protein